MIRVLLADDEKHIRERLKEMLKKYNIFTIESEAKNGDEVIKEIISKKPDVAFLDINMPGVSVFESIPSLKNAPIIIFQTAYSEYAVNAFGINALDYLLKPISEERLDQTVEKIKKEINAKLKKDNEESLKEIPSDIENISVKNQGRIKVIPIDEVYKITFEEGFSFIYTYEGRFLSDKYLNYYEELLKDRKFFRVSRSDLINTKYISIIHPMFKGSYVIELKNGAKIKLSRRRAGVLKKLIDF